MEFGELEREEDFERALEKDGAVYLRSFGASDATLLEVGETLGSVVAPGVGMPGGAHDGRIYRVEVRNAGAGFEDKYGNTIVSTTNREFELHTDAYNDPHPPHYVFLARSDNSDDATPSYIADAREALDRVPAITPSLGANIFPSALGPTSILSSPSGAELRVRFNPDELRRWAGRDGNPQLTDDVELIVSEFSRALQAVTIKTVIMPGDCLVLNNWLVCHGRGSMATSSKRVLKRMWVA